MRGHLRVLAGRSGRVSSSLPAVSNVGLRPTFEDRQGFMAEAGEEAGGVQALVWEQRGAQCEHGEQAQT